MNAVAGQRTHDSPLLERADALARLDTALAGRGRVVFVTGDAGIGKTSLLRHFRSAHPELPVRWGACERLFTPRALGPFLDIAGTVAREPTALLAELSAERTVVVLEDFHWADEGSLDLLQFLTHRIDATPVLLVVSFRDDELAPAHVVLAELATSPNVQRIELPPLSVAAVRTLADDAGRDADEVYRLTAGNPFFVIEALNARSATVPRTVRDAVMARASRLSPSARRLLEAAAVVPSPVELWLLDALANTQLDALDECIDSGVLYEESGRLAFRHELARRAFEDLIAPHRRQRLHRAALERLAQEDDPDPARLAHHAEAADDAAAVSRYAPAAGDQAARLGAHREAAAQFARALNFGADLPVPRRAALLERRAYECYLSDDPDAALEAWQEALGLWRAAGDPLAEGTALTWIARLLFFSSRDGEADEAVASAIALLEAQAPGRELGRAYAALSHFRLLAGAMGDAIDWGMRALALADQLGETEVVVHSLNNVGAAELALGVEAGRAKLERSLALARDAGLVEHVTRAYVNLASAAVDGRDCARAERYLDEGIAYAEEHEIGAWRWYLISLRARVELDRGRSDLARASADRVLAGARKTSFARLNALAVLARIRARRGEPDPVAPLDEAGAIAALNGHLQQLGPVAAARAELAWLGGDSDTVVRVTEDAFALARRLGDGQLTGELALWRARAGHHVTVSAPEPYASELAGEWARAAECWEQLGCPYEAALARAHGDDEATRRALDDLHELDARAAARVVARRLRDRGAHSVRRGPRQTTRSNPAGLTSRELEVLRLLRLGQTNAQIAGALVVSQKTAEHHVAAIMRKLGVSSRRDAADAAARLEQ